MRDTCADSRNTDDPSAQAAPAHQDFQWVEGPSQATPYAQFLGLVLDISAGIHVGLQIAYSSTLERAANADADPGGMVVPAVGIVEADQLQRMAIAAARLLRDESRRRVELLSQPRCSQASSINE